MSPQSAPSPLPSDKALLTPREVAELFGVRTTTVARWAREGRLSPMRTPGNHRRYRADDVRALLDEVESVKKESVLDPEAVEDVVRLYAQGWSIRQVADRFECSYGAIRRILLRRKILRRRGRQELRMPLSQPGAQQVPQSADGVWASRDRA
jgi:excisionase family DNA binding protein